MNAPCPSCTDALSEAAPDTSRSARLAVGSIAVGTYVLQLFGISLPVVRLGGGLLVASTAWGMLNRAARDEVQAAVAEGEGVVHAVRLSPRLVAGREGGQTRSHLGERRGR